MSEPVASDKPNPYASPQEAQAAESAIVETPERTTARNWIRWTALTLLIPGLANWACFEFVLPHLVWRLGGDPFVPPLFYVGVNFLFVVGIAALIYLGGLRVIEMAAAVAHMIFGGDTSREAWMRELHIGLWPLKWASQLGALLWMAWLYLFYFTDIAGIGAISLFCTLLGHLLGAWVYGTVFYRWYQLRHRPATAED